MGAKGHVSASQGKCDVHRSEAIIPLVHQMMETDMLPISVEEGEGFKVLAQYLNPK